MQPPVRKEVIDLRGFGGGESGEHVLHVLEGVDAQPLARLNQAHECRGGLTSFFRTREEPVASANYHGLDTALAGVIADFNEGVVEVDEQSRPAVQCVRNCVSEFCFGWFEEFGFIEPSFQQRQFWLRQPLAQVLSFSRRQSCCDPLNVEQAFDDPHWKFCRNRIALPGIFKVAVHVGPTVGCRSAVLNDLVELVGPVRLKNSSKAFENSFRIDRMLGIGVIVEDVGMVSISTVDPDERFVGLTESFLDHRQSGCIRLNDAAAQDEVAHSADNRSQKRCNLFHPSTHGGTTYRNTQGLKDLLLAVKWQVQPEFVGCDLSQQSRTRQALIDRLVRFLSRDNLTVAFLASVLKHGVLDGFEKCLDKLDLVRDVESDDLARLSTARTRNFVWTDAMFFLSSLKVGGRCRTSAALSLIRHNVQSILLCCQFICSLSMNGLAGAGQKVGIDLGGLLSKGRAIAPAQLFFKLGDANKQFLDEAVAIVQVIGQLIRIFRRFRVSHDFGTCAIDTKVYYATVCGGTIFDDK